MRELAADVVSTLTDLAFYLAAVSVLGVSLLALLVLTDHLFGWAKALPLADVHDMADERVSQGEAFPYDRKPGR
jgi:hypothetical protein